MKTCVFFGHRNFDYEPYREKIEQIVVDLIENEGVTDFYNGGRGRFDSICTEIVQKLKIRYPQICNILILSYIRLLQHSVCLFVRSKVYHQI